MVTIDIEKAFDSVDHTFLLCALRKFGFGNNFIKWVKIILNRQENRGEKPDIGWSDTILW